MPRQLEWMEKEAFFCSTAQSNRDPLTSLMSRRTKTTIRAHYRRSSTGNLTRSLSPPLSLSPSIWSLSCSDHTQGLRRSPTLSLCSPLQLLFLFFSLSPPPPSPRRLVCQKNREKLSLLLTHHDSRFLQEKRRLRLNIERASSSILRQGNFPR